MHGGAITLAKKFLKSDIIPDLILCSDMLDLTTFLSLTRKRSATIPTAIYFHENQLTYPWSVTDKDVQMKRNNHYAFINCVSALAADKVFFNSNYHLESFMNEMPKFLKGFPDHNELNMVDRINEKSKVLYLGMNLKKYDECRIEKNNEVPVILWNHRWEYDKNPKNFFNALINIQEKGIDFRLVVLGESFSQNPIEFTEAKEKLADKILHFGYVDGFEEYANWLWRSDILPVTSNQDFFGGSVVQAMYCNVYPLVPNRLAYHEHIPKDKKSDYIYSNQIDFENKLIELIISKKSKNINTQKFVSKYDWSFCVKEYDDLLEITDATAEYDKIIK